MLLRVYQDWVQNFHPQLDYCFDDIEQLEE